MRSQGKWKSTRTTAPGPTSCFHAAVSIYDEIFRWRSKILDMKNMESEFRLGPPPVRSRGGVDRGTRRSTRRLADRLVTRLEVNCFIRGNARKSTSGVMAERKRD